VKYSASSPPGVVRHDGDDPYLVVAADKGTATFSDIANALARDYGFWLDDAFASGGSAGYDHKKMGITARGAWESVKRHFREFGRDTQSQAFTVAGIGDMSGDVFGNGMLLSQHIRMQDASNHQHISLDPDPDEKVSFRERQRLFRKGRSSWTDYERGALSAIPPPVSLVPSLKSRSSVTEPTAMTGRPVMRFVTAARVASPPGKPGSQKRRVEACSTSTPASRNSAAIVARSSVVGATRAAKSTSFHCEKRSEMRKSGPQAARMAATISAGKRRRWAMSGPP